jgi:hypothetical protein
MNYFMSYSTANEGDYQEDFFNFLKLAERAPGVEKVQLYIAVSEVKTKTARDEKALEQLRALAERNPRIEVKALTFKSNIGRDFSSAAVNLRLIERTAQPEDFVLFTNRSGYGPLCDNWYGAYVEQYRRFPDVHLCGSSISFMGHPDGIRRANDTHVQTYAFLSQMRHLEKFLEYFPAEDKTVRLDVIDYGEIAISQRMMEAGGALTCLAWPEHKFDSRQPVAERLPHADIKREIVNVPFVYKRKLWRNTFGHFKFASWRKTICEFDQRPS